jgi:hypothetical protein
MGKRSRARGRAEKPDVPVSDYDGLVLRGVLTAKTRREYDAVRGSATREDAWQRAVEFLFERLAVSWTVDGVQWSGQKELLARLRAANGDERRFVRDALRTHCAEWFPDVEAP